MQVTERNLDSTIIYPVSDGEPVAETYNHLYAILVTLEVLKQYLFGQQATVLANQFLYYAQGFPKLRVAPDVIVIFGVEPGGRDSFKTWEEGAVPSVIFEMTSKSTKQEEQLEVEEYWLFDPRGEWLESLLVGYRLVNEVYVPITDSCSEVLGLQLEVEDKLIQFTEIQSGRRLLHPSELKKALEEAQQQVEQAQEQAEKAQQQIEQLKAQLRALGVSPIE